MFISCRDDLRFGMSRLIAPGPLMIALLVLSLAAGGVWGTSVDHSGTGMPLLTGPEHRSRSDSGVVIRGGNPGWPVWADGRYIGRIPVVRDTLAAGPVLIEVGLPPEEASWFRPWPVRAVLRPASVDTLHVEPLQRLRLTTSPAGARVWRDGAEVGRTPLNALLPATVAHHLHFRAAGHASRHLTYDPMGRPDSLLAVALVPLQQRDHPTMRSESPWITRAQTLLPLAAMVLGGTGLWARHRADSAYDDYMQTVDRSRMSSNLDRAGRYDRAASALWISAEVCLLGAVTAWVIGSRRSADLATGADVYGPSVPDPPPNSLRGSQEEGMSDTGSEP